MRELLEKWASSGDTATQEGFIKHPRCYEHSPGEPDAFCVLHSRFWHGWRVDPDKEHDHPHILAATIEAITARSWMWSLGTVTSRPSIWGFVNPDETRSYKGTSDTPAEALLAAYLKALEAEAQP